MVIALLRQGTQVVPLFLFFFLYPRYYTILIAADSIRLVSPQEEVVPGRRFTRDMTLYGQPFYNPLLRAFRLYWVLTADRKALTSAHLQHEYIRNEPLL